MNNEIPHIGEIIRQKVEEKGMSKMDFADAINCCRRNVYDIFKRKRINETQLKSISKVLNFDFKIPETNMQVKDCLVIVKVTKEQCIEVASKYQVIFIYEG